MVTVAVIGIFATSLFFAGTSRIPEYRNEMRADIVDMLTLFSNARSMAINSAVTEDESGELVSNVKYGVYLYFQSTPFYAVLFADTNHDLMYDGSDTIISSVQLFDEPFMDDVSVGITLDDVDRTDQLTVLFEPLSTETTLVRDNDSNFSENLSASSVLIDIDLDGILEEDITFNSISRFFERTQIEPS